MRKMYHGDATEGAKRGIRMKRETKSGVRRKVSHDHNRQAKPWTLLELQHHSGYRD
jgi:hypothetical protein